MSAEAAHCIACRRHFPWHGEGTPCPMCGLTSTVRRGSMSVHVREGRVRCEHCGDTGVEPGSVVIPAGHGSGFNSIDPDPEDRGSYVPCTLCLGESTKLESKVTEEMLAVAYEAFLTKYPAGMPNEHGELGLTRDLRSALEAAFAMMDPSAVESS